MSHLPIVHKMASCLKRLETDIVVNVLQSGHVTTAGSVGQKSYLVCHVQSMEQ